MELDSMSKEELEALSEEAGHRLAKIQTKEAVDREFGALQDRLRESGALPSPAQGEEWVQPTSDWGTHYGAGDRVTHNGQLYESSIALNAWEPGTQGSGWNAVAVEGEWPPAWEQPYAHNPYNAGDRMSLEGHAWEAVADGVVHPPSTAPDSWRDVTDEYETE